MTFLLAYLMLILILILIFLSMVHEYAYFFMNTFGKGSIAKHGAGEESNTFISSTTNVAYYCQ